MKVVSFMPHGALPDVRGFAPALAAYNLVKNLRFSSPVTICSREHYRERFVIDQEIGPIHRLHQGRVYTRLFRKITRWDPWPLHARAAKIVNDVAPDVFHVHQLEFPLKDFRSAVRSQLPVVVHAHAVRTFDEGNGVADKYIAVSDYTRRQLIERGYPAEHVEVVYNGVDTDLFSPADPDQRLRLRAVLGIPADAMVLSYVARKQAVKGFFTFLQAARNLLQRYDRLFVVAVGPRPADARLESEYADILGLSQSLTQSGRFIEFPALPHKRLANIYQITDVILAPTYLEQHPLAICEALSSGCVTIASDIAGIPETMTDGVSGFLLNDPRSVEEATETTAQALDKLGELDSLRARARAHAVENFGWARSAEKLERLYFALAGHAKV